LTIDSEGKVIDAKVLKPSGARPLDDAAARCVVQNWRYKPALKNGLRIAATTEVQIVWQLRRP